MSNAIKPKGFIYLPNFISEEEEKSFIKQISLLDWEVIKLHGKIAKRRVVHFGLIYNYDNRSVKPGKKIPGFLNVLIKRVSSTLKINSKEIVEILISKYSQGAGIGWHKDSLAFGDSILGISLENSCTLKLRKKDYIYKIEIEPKSAYILSGESRYEWEHSILPLKKLRYSITFRTLSTF